MFAWLAAERKMVSQTINNYIAHSNDDTLERPNIKVKVSLLTHSFHVPSTSDSSDAATNHLL